MFDIAVFANPAKLRKDFLATTEVQTQKMGPELQSEFDKMREENPSVLMTGSFWLDFIRTYRKHLSLLVFGRAVMTVLVLITVLASEGILNESNSLKTAIGFLVFYTVIQIILKLINAWNALYQSQLFVNTRTFVTLRVNTKLLRMGQLSTNDFSTGNLKTLISSDVYRIGELFHAIARNGLPCILALIILGPMIVYYMGLPGLISIVVGFGAMPLSFFLAKYIHSQEELIKKEEDTLSTIIGEWVTNVRLLRFLGWEALMRTRVGAHVRQLVIESTKQHGVNLINFGISVTWWLFPIVTLIAANQLLGGEKDLVKIFASIWMLNHITLYIRWLPDIFISYASASACVNRLNALFLHRDIKDDLLPAVEGLELHSVPIKLHFRDVAFEYEGEKEYALSSLNLIINLCERVSLIGRVGAGKSTFLKLVCAEIKPTSGQILVEMENGQLVDLWHENVYHLFREVLGYMPQEAYLSNTSLAVNVSLDTSHNEDDVMKAIRLAELEADIGHWAAGISEEIGETGVNLSGGQKQRVNLARALYSGRPYLVLDDPLSAVDTDTESALMQTLLSNSEGFLLCSHRLSELSKTDRILVLEKGHVIEDDTPQSLIDNVDSEFNRQLQAGSDFDLTEKAIRKDEKNVEKGGQGGA
ncbi:MAG: ABC-type bacteriocin/lantibiotic exporter with double-glycine peptidase domain [Candidatus Azotimanducaceae bacterium]|jgi:ABC-type bacteriocin/lantibiotic exporter with double-glycine peptidase domain